MGKGDVVMKFDAQTAVFVQAVEEARSKLEAGAQTTRKFGEHAESAGDKALHLAQHLTGVTNAEGLMERGLESLGEKWEIYLERMKVKAEELLKKVITLSNAVAGSGQGAAAPEVRERLEKLGQMKIGAMQVGGADATTQYAAISDALKGKHVSADDKIKATVVSLFGEATGMDTATAQQLGINFANIARQPGLSNRPQGELEDLALNATIDGGQLSERELRFLAEADDKKQALDVIRAARGTDEPAKALAKVQEIVDKPKGRLHAIPAGQRMQQLLADPSLAPAEDRRLISNLAEGMKQLPASRSLEQEVAGAAANPALRSYFDSHNADVYVERKKEEGAEKALQLETAKKVSKADRPYTPGWMVNTGAAIAGMMTDSAGTPQIQQANAPTAAGTAERTVDVLEKIHLSLTDIHQEQKHGASPGLKTNHEGQK